MIFSICHNMIQTFWLVKSHRNLPSLVLRFKDQRSKKSPEKSHIGLNIQSRRIFSTKEVEASYGDHQVEIRAIEAATGHSGQSEQEAEAEEGVEAGGQGTAAGPLWEQFDHDDNDELCHMSVSRYQVLSALELS